MFSVKICDFGSNYRYIEISAWKYDLSKLELSFNYVDYCLCNDILEVSKLLEPVRFMWYPLDIRNSPFFQICIRNTEYLWLKKPCDPSQSSKGCLRLWYRIMVLPKNQVLDICRSLQLSKIQLLTMLMEIEQVYIRFHRSWPQMSQRILAKLFFRLSWTRYLLTTSAMTGQKELYVHEQREPRTYQETRSPVDRPQPSYSPPSPAESFMVLYCRPVCHFSLWP